MGMAHRGRLNVLANVLGKSYAQIFREFEGELDPSSTQGSGDVKYHLGAARQAPVARRPRGPCHAWPPTRATSRRSTRSWRAWPGPKQDRARRRRTSAVLPVLIHGDAAFAGPGRGRRDAEPVRGRRATTSAAPSTSSSTTSWGSRPHPDSGRSGVYATDVAKMVQAPIFHVNGDDPEACVRVIRLAFEFRQAFKKDVVVDLVCYRRYGHNEADEPAFTQPRMYDLIDGHPSVRQLYTEPARARAATSREDDEQRAAADFRARLDRAFEETHELARHRPPRRGAPRRARPGRRHRPSSRPTPRWRPRCSNGSSTRSTTLARVVPRAPQAGPDPRSRRGTRSTAGTSTGRSPRRWRSARCCWRARRCASRARTPGGARSASATACSSTTETEAEYVPLERTSATTRRRSCSTTRCSRSTRRSGSSTATRSPRPTASPCWEAQFGDFANGAQIDRSTSSSSPPRTSGASAASLVLLLPHGFEGQGPDHSSARLERFLALSADDNLRVVYPTTAAQYFHVLRRQARATHRVPLVCLTPKRYLRMPQSRSPLEALTRDRFHRVLGDRSADLEAAAVRRVLVCSGKLAHELMDERDRLGVPVAVVRVEQLYPWPEPELTVALDRYPDATPGVVGAGGAGEHGGVALDPRAAPAGARRPGRPRPRRAARGGEPGQWERQGPRARAAGAPAGGAGRAVDAGTQAGVTLTVAPGAGTASEASTASTTESA